LLAEVDDLSFEVGDLPVEGIDVGGLPSPGLVPDLLAEGFGQAFFEMLAAGVRSGGAFVSGK
jgi:hypothetical protein